MLYNEDDIKLYSDYPMGWLVYKTDHWAWFLSMVPLQHHHFLLTTDTP